jgi:Protein of unknown function (DUF1592)/Protein of unknown function (DUF1588)
LRAPAGAKRRLTPLQLKATLERALLVDDGQVRESAVWTPLRLHQATSQGILGALNRTTPTSELFSHDATIASSGPLFIEAMAQLSETLVSKALSAAQRLHPCATKSISDSCAMTIVQTVGPRLFRRPLTDDETLTFSQDYQMRLSAMSRSDSLAMVLRRMVLSAYTAFRFEIPESDGHLSDYALADWLSFTLTDAPASAQLFLAAASGQLHTESDVRREASALLSSLQTAPALERFAAEWLPYEESWTLKGKPAVTNAAQARARAEQAYRETTRAFFAEEDNTLASLLASERGEINADLAQWYGVPFAPPSGSQWARVQLPPNRSGFLQRPGFLAALTGTTSRALFIRERLLCTPVSLPPGNVNTNLDEVTTDLEREAGRPLSPREVRQKHMGNPACSGCHSKIDPLGFPLDGFDEEGAPRKTFGGFPVETQGALLDTDVDGPVADGKALSVRLSTSQNAARCVSQHVFSIRECAASKRRRCLRG